MDKALTLLHLQKSVLQAGSFDEVVFIALNKTHLLVPYDQAIFFEWVSGKLKAKSVSGNALIDPESTLSEIIAACAARAAEKDTASQKDNTLVHAIMDADIPDLLRSKWDSVKHRQNILLALKTQQEGDLGYALFQRDKKFDEAEIAILEELAQTYAHAAALQKLRQPAGYLGRFHASGHLKKALLVGAALAFFCPVRMTITAPAEIVAEGAKTINAPYEGIIDEILVKPGDSVESGSIIARMDREALSTQEQSAKQALDLAQISLSRARRESLADPDKKSEISRLQAEIRTRQIEYDYAKTLLERSEMSAPQSGIAIFADVNALQGKPVAAGETIMRIADPEKQELLIRVPVDAMIAIQDDAALSFHANVKPLSNYKGHLTMIGYDASLDADGLLTYKLRAALDNTDDFRIGWKGSARIYGAWTVLGYSILRRPLIALRNITGI